MNAVREDGVNMREALDKLVKGRNTPQKIVMRAKIAIKVLEGMPKKRIAEELNVELGGLVGYQVRFTDQASAETGQVEDRLGEHRA